MPDSVEATDARGRTIRLPGPARRIVSLVPSATKTLFDLGAGPRVVGITRFCVHPASELVGLKRVGGTKDADPAEVLRLEPDLVVANCEENTAELFDHLDSQVPVWAAFPRTVDQAIADIDTLGRLVGSDQASHWCDSIRAERERLHAVARSFAYTYLVWRRPWMAVSDDTFVAAMLAEAGGRSEVETLSLGARFPEIDPADLARRQGLVLLSSEPFPFGERHARELSAEGVHPERIRFVDGELLGWHGTAMAAAFAYLRTAVSNGDLGRP